MKRTTLYRLLLAFLVLFPAVRAQESRTDRTPAVAGQFYPADKEELRETLKQLYSRAVPAKNLGTVVAVIAPHAGFVYSGEVAASGFAQVDASREYDTVFLLGPSHRVALEGAAVYTEGDFVTPLGTVRVNSELARRLVKESTVIVSRSDAHQYEHSLEVQLPFLQYRMKKGFRIVPVVIGASDPTTCRAVARALQPYFTARNLFVISTDFSHYPSYIDARKVDAEIADAIIANSPDRLMEVIRTNEAKGIPNLATCMCGWPAVLTLLYMTHTNAACSYVPIQYKNSGDSEYGQKDQVVGYHAIAVVQKRTQEEPSSRILDDGDKRDMLGLARNAIGEYLARKQVSAPDLGKLPAVAKKSGGAFVSLYKRGALRGCIGRFVADEPLYTVIQSMAVAAATEDHRFPPVQAGELKDLEIEISVLSPMRKVRSIDEIQLGKHGVYIQKENRGGTFLPQVATETGWSKEEFLGHCAQDKAGIGWNGWKDAEIFVYEAQVFREGGGRRR